MLLIKNGYVITMDPMRNVFTKGAIVIENNKIIEVGQSQTLEQKYPEASVLDASGKAVLPGLINAHTHIYQILYRGLGDDLSLADWLKKCIWPLSANLTRDDCHAAALLASLEMIKSGSTTFVDSHYINKDKECHDGIVEGAEKIGIRGVLGRCTVDSYPTPEEFRETVDTAQKEAAKVIEKYHGYANGRITVRVEPLNELLASPEMIKAMREISKQYGVGMNMHVAETMKRTQDSRENFGMPSIEYLNDLGVLGPDVLLAHCCWLTKKEIQILADTDTKVAHNPVSNQYLADGVAPVPEMLRKGITVTIGPDGACSNNNLDMFGVMKSAALLHKVNELDPQAMTANKALEMATIDAARALGMEKEIGSLEKGKKADVILVNVRRANMIPSLAIVSNLVYSCTGDAVDTVIIDGKVIMKNREVLTVDEEKILVQADNVVKNLVEKSNATNLINSDSWNYV
ncbi:MAG: amidohydrolase [Bacillota bacterium]|jgi:5-methylthioadenosine/S-adenosylhomocysteine deaminase